MSENRASARFFDLGKGYRAVIFLLTDFGAGGPYLGEVHAALRLVAPEIPVIDLMHDLPAFEPGLSAYLVAPLVQAQPPGSVFVCVVDPGVGTSARRPVWLEADGRILVGPDNGLMQVVACDARRQCWHEILWKPRQLSASFHGRDLFAPVAARLAGGESVASRRLRRRSRFSSRWPTNLHRIVYVDGYGNLITGIRAGSLARRDTLVVGGARCRYARTFGDTPPGTLFWYHNSMQLVEVACSRGSAASHLSVCPGEAVSVSR